MSHSEPAESTAQDKLRKIIREETSLILNGEKKANKPFQVALIGLAACVMAGLLVFINAKPYSAPVETVSASIAVSQIPGVRQTYGEKNPLEFIVAANAALVFYEDGTLDAREISMALELFSKRRAENIGEPVGLVKEKNLGTPLDAEIMLDVFDRSLAFLENGINDAGLGLDDYAVEKLSKDPIVRKERLIQKINKAVNKQDSPEKIIEQMISMGLIFSENGRFSGDENILQREAYKRTADLIISRVDPRL